MKILHVYRSEPNDDVKRLVEIVSEGRDNENFNLNVDAPDYDKLVDMVWGADQTICWW
ncbi:MAG: hypothetical protein KKC76_09070 [Proteobacteria bacterium]|nr:hypothetical protein [Pseudomonadota bacterium]MBU4298000.1 hypothetical protein [Pseudomonadota bacterium]MCG2749560.1 hypothetical protein [Desulfobulbaceae bacterium]